MLVSVITVTRNVIEAGRKEMFRQCVDSIRSQSGAEVQHVVYDGASTDGSAEILAAMAERGEVSVFRSEPDRGVYDAMNRAVALSRGDYLVFLNSDDFMNREDGIADLVAHCTDTPDFVVAPVTRIGLSGATDTMGVSRFNARILVSMPFCHQGLAMRRDLFLKLGGFDTGYSIMADYDLILRMFIANVRGAQMARPFSTFREGGLSSDRQAMRAEYRDIWKRNLPGASGVGEDDWRTAQDARTLPRTVLNAISASERMPQRLRWIARWHLLRRLRSA